MEKQCPSLGNLSPLRALESACRRLNHHHLAAISGEFDVTRYERTSTEPCVGFTHCPPQSGCLIGCHMQAVVTTIANDDVVSTWERDAVKVRVTHQRKIVITHLLSRHSRDSQQIVFFVLFLFLFFCFFSVRQIKLACHQLLGAAHVGLVLGSSACMQC